MSRSALARLPSRLLRVHPSVQHALARRGPIVALESTIITHGLPSPQNLQVATALEDVVRQAGATPATIALLDGRVHVGLSHKELERLAETGPAATKTSRRDIAAVLAASEGSVGATTVSGTMALAHMTGGIHTFGTGGIGGVHRGGHNSMDVSADLTELSRTPMAVFASGAKSILDIPRTLEYLETMGVAVHTFEKNGQFPAFYSSQSGCKVPRVASEDEAARLINASLTLGLQSGMLFGVPIPEQYEEAGSVIQAAVEQAVREHVEAGIDKLGKEATPWLLKRVNELTQGQSVESNTALVMNNVAVAARTAVKLHAIHTSAHDGQSTGEKTYPSANVELRDESKSGDIYVFGCAALDIISIPEHAASNVKSAPSDSGELERKIDATTVPGYNRALLGGVGRNMAEAAHQLSTASDNFGGETILVSPLAHDAFGVIVRAGMAALNMPDTGLYTLEEPTARTASVLLKLTQDGDLIDGVADMHNADLPAHVVTRTMENLNTSETRCVIGFDGNISTDAMREIFDNRRPQDFVLFEPTSVTKAQKIIDLKAETKMSFNTIDILEDGGERFEPLATLQIEAMTPNSLELNAMHTYAQELGLPLLSDEDRGESDDSEEDNLTTQAWDMATLFNCAVIVKLGPVGAMIFQKIDEPGIRARRRGRLIQFPAEPLLKGELVSTTGAGDTLAGTVLACARAVFDAEDASGRVDQERNSAKKSSFPWDDILDLGQEAARLTLKHTAAVSPHLGQLTKQIEEMAECVKTGEKSKRPERPTPKGAIERRNLTFEYN